MERLEHNNLFSWPANASFQSFIDSFDTIAMINNGSHTFLEITWNSIWRTTTYVLLSILTSSMVCYILVFYRSKFTKFLYNLGIFVAILPLYGSTAATLRLYDALNFINNPFALITSIGLYGGYFFYMYSFYKSLSWDYAEAAFVDGASHYRVFFQIMLPMALPSIAALFVMSFISAWNDYESTILYMTKYPNLAYAVYGLEEVNKYYNITPAYMASVLITLVPILVLFLIFQNSIMEKVHLGGLKGY
jgi:raffinose/stachyose/melibiose transport system permease protein/N-acetylglucosamine transport system permease protein